MEDQRVSKSTNDKNTGISHKYNEGTTIEEQLSSEDEKLALDAKLHIGTLSSNDKYKLDKLAESYGMEPKYYCNALMKDKAQSEYTDMLEKETTERLSIVGKKGKKEREYLRKKQKALRGLSESAALNEEYDFEIPKNKSILTAETELWFKRNNLKDPQKIVKSSDSDSDESYGNRRRSRRKRSFTEKIEYISEFNSGSIMNRRVYDIKPKNVYEEVKPKEVYS